MVRVQAFPYLRPSRDLITNIEWQLVTDDASTPLPEQLPHWDSLTSISASISVRLDIAQIWQECRLAEEDRLRLILLWSSSGTGLRGRGNEVTIYRNYPLNTLGLDVHVSGGQIADQVKFTLQLILAQPGKSNFKLAPHRAGCILWSEEKTIVLVGQGPRFPTETISFAAYSHSLPAGAAWYLDWDPKGLEERFMGSVRLFLNSENVVIRKATHGQTREDRLIQSMIRFDLGKTMITAALGNDEFVQNYRQYEEGTVGATIRNMLQVYFPSEVIEGLASQYRNSPGRLECALQDRFRMFEEV